MGKQLSHPQRGIADLSSRYAGPRVALLIPIIIGLFLFVSSVSFVFPWLDILDSKRLFQTGIIPLLFLITLISPAPRNAMYALLRRTPVPVLILLAVFFLLGALSSSRFTHPSYSYVEVGMLFNLVLLVFVVASARVVAGQTFDRVSLVFVAGLGAAVVLQESMGLLASLSLGSEFTYDNMFIYFSHPRFYNQVQTWTLPVIAAIPFVFPASKKIVGITLLLLAAQWYLLLASGARGSIVGLTFAILLTGLLALPNSIKWLKLHVAGALSGLFVYISIWQIQNISTTDGGQFVAQSLGRSLTNTTGRTWMWGFAWRDALQHPWLGAGPARFTCNGDVRLPAHPHNIVLQLLAEWGFPATLIILGVAFYLAWKLLRSLRSLPPLQKSSLLQVSLITALIAAAVHASVSGLLVMPASQMAGVLVGGWLLGVLFQTTKTTGRAGLFSLILVVGLGFSLAITVFAVSEVRQLESRMLNFSNEERRMPRFWHEGRVCRFFY